MNIKSIITLMFTLLLTTSALAAPLPITLERVEIDDQEVTVNAQTRFDIERDNELDIEIKLSSTQALRDVEVEAFISGFEFNDVERISDVTPLFDMDAQVSYVKKLQLTLPDDVDEDDYKLRIIVTDRNNEALIQDFALKVDVPRHSLKVEDVTLFPADRVTAGSSLLATIRLENQGEQEEEDIKVTFSIPELGVSATDFIEDIDSNDEEEETEELFLRIPRCAKPGTYATHIDVAFNNQRRKLTETRQITILENEQCTQDNQPQLTVTLGSNAETTTAGNTVVFPITLINTGRTAKSFTLSPQAVSFGSIDITPTSTTVLEPGRAQTFHLTIQTTRNTPAGTHNIPVNILSGAQTLQELSLNLTIQSQGLTLRRILEVGVVGLLILLIIIGLIIGFSKLNSNEDDDTDHKKSEKYY